MRRATSPDFLLSVAQHPRNRFYTGAAWGCYDAARWARTVALEWPDGGVVFEQLKSGAWEAHWCFLPRAHDVVGKGKQAVSYLFSHTPAHRIIGKTPTKFRHALKASAAVGMRHLFTCNGTTYTELCRSELKDED